MNKAKYIYAAAIGAIIIACIILIVSGNKKMEDKENLKDGQSTTEISMTSDDNNAVAGAHAGLDTQNDKLTNENDKNQNGGYINDNAQGEDPQNPNNDNYHSQADKKVLYRLIYENGKVSIYEENAFFDYADINVNNLPSEIKEKLFEGLELHSEKELYEFLQTYSS